jgi:hypothetical protein
MEQTSVFRSAHRIPRDELDPVGENTRCSNCLGRNYYVADARREALSYAMWEARMDIPPEIQEHYLKSQESQRLSSAQQERRRPVFGLPRR